MSSHLPRWRELVPGLLVLTACALAVLFVLRYARIGALRGETFPLVVLGGSAQDLLTGTEVWLAGQPVGQVEAVEFRPAATDTTLRLAINIQVYERARQLLRSDSHARITTGGSPLGAAVLALTPGTLAGQPLGDGDTLRMRPGPSLGALGGELMAGARLEELGASVQAITGLVAGARGTVGAVLHDSAGMREVTELRTRGQGLAASVQRGRGTLGGFARGAEPQRRVEQAMARVDSIRLLLDSGQGNVGRFRRDSTLVRAIDDVRNEVDILRALLASPDGTIGRAQVDGIVALQLDSASARLAALARDVRQRPLRYLIF